MLRGLSSVPLERLGSFITRARGAGGPRRRGLGLFVALVLFVGGSVLGFLNLPEVNREPRWELLAVVGLVGVPLTLALNAAEYQVAAAIASYRVSFLSALRVGVLATAANLLPVPGAVFVRAQAIRRLGASYGKIALSTGVVAVCFLGTTCATAAGVLVASGVLVVGGLLAGASVVLRGAAGGTRGPRRPPAQALALVLSASARAAGAIAVKAGRIYLILLAFGYEAGLTQALTLTIAAVIVTLLGFVPGGLGVAEAVAAAVSPLVGLSSAVGFVVSAVDRLISLLGLAVAAGAILLLDRRGTLEEAPVSEPDGTETGSASDRAGAAR
jgi:uncharacterized membrane protein YbhN (UPF0104 family)